MSAPTSSSSGQGDNPGNSGNFPVRKRFGGKVFIETYDSSDDESDYDKREHTGGAKLNASPYRPPQIRAAKSKDSIKGKAVATGSPANNGTLVTPESTDSGSPLAVKLGKMTFQRGDPTDVDVFETTASSSGEIKSEDTDEPLSPRAIDAKIANATGRTLVAQAAQDLVVGHDHAAVMHQPTSGRHLVGDQDAQRVYAHTSCVFIANLPQDKSDEALEAEVTRNFSPFGTVFVKIKRDDRDMPFGFLQYTNDGDAAAAVQYGHGMKIFGRGCRVEMAKANRTFIVHRHDHASISVAEVIPMVSPFGQLSVVERLRRDFAEIMRLPNAIFVEFAVFDCERDIVNRYRGHRTFRVAQFDITKLFRAPPRTNPDGEYLSAYQKDRVSVWVGQLTLDATEAQLRQLFEEAGDVVRVQLVQRFHLQYGSFAFVEFSRPDMAEVAIHLFHGKQHLGTQLVVQHKLTKGGAPRRINSAYARQVAGQDDATRSAGRGGPTPRQAITAVTSSNPYLDAQANMVVEDIPSVHVTPSHAQNGASAGSASVAPMVASSQSATPVVRAPATTTPGGGLAAPASTLSALAPPFGPSGYFVPSPNMNPMTPIGAFQPNIYTGFNANPYPTFNNQFQTFNNQAQQPGFFAPQMTYYQDPASGLIYPMPPITAPPMVNQTPIFGQRSVSAQPYVPAAEVLARNSNEAIKPKKSVTFADPIAESSSAQEKNGQASSTEKDGAA